MPYPTPYITNIRLLSGVPLDRSYRHSIYFGSAGAQQGYFAGKVVSGLSWNDCMYHREQQAIRVNATIEACEGVNYAMFQNTAYGSKWFYAFVTDHVYINANCTELKIEIDVLQTWYFDYTIPPCFIERCHTTTDAIGEHLAPENIEYGEYVIYDGAEIIGGRGEWEVIMWCTFDQAAPSVNAGGDISTGLYSALTRNVIGRVNMNNFYSPNWTADPRFFLKNILDNYADKVEGIVAITMSPVKTYPLTVPFTRRATTIDGYTPRNKRLYSYPYNVICVNNSSGTETILRNEYFKNASGDTRWTNGSTVDFEVRSDKAPNETILVIPKDYRVRGTSYDYYSINDFITLTGFPQCAWISDSFKTYLAQNATSLALTAGMGAIKTIGGVAAIAGSSGSASPIAGGLVVSGIADLASVIGTEVGLTDKARVAPVDHGNITGTGLMSKSLKSVSAFNMCIHADYAKRIDDYFDLVGYAQNRIGTVNIHARPYWTYVKTRGAAAIPTGSGAPAAALQEIQNIYDRGVTFWTDGSHVGDYSLNNTV